MVKRAVLLLAIGALAFGPANATPPRATVETTPFELAQTFLRQLGTFERDRLQAVKDQATNPKDFASCVRNMTTFQMDLGVSSRYLLSAKLSETNMAKTIPAIVGSVIGQKYDVVGELIKECQAFMVYDSKINYTELAQSAPKITAMSNYVDKTLFQGSPAMFIALIDPRPDSKNRANHLLITRAQRDHLLKDLAIDFGDELNMSGDDVPYYVAIAQLFRDKLSEYKCADDPWE